MSSGLQAPAAAWPSAGCDADAPIGVFDSGVGGLSVLREIRAAMPSEHLIYLADSANAPYGDRDAAFVRERAARMVDELVARGVKAVVIACNTASVLAAERLRVLHAIPIVAMEPAIKPAVRLSRSRVITVLATRQTLASTAVDELVAAHRDDARIILQPCPGLVERIEAGDLDGPGTRRLVEHGMARSIAAGADVVVLGCTHYPFVAPLIRAAMGDAVRIVDSGAAVAAQLQRRIDGSTAPAGEGSIHWLSTAAGPRLQAVVGALWGEPVRVESLAG